MEIDQIFKELMKSEELQTHFKISKEDTLAANLIDNASEVGIAMVQDVIRGVANKKSIKAVYQGIIKKTAQ